MAAERERALTIQTPEGIVFSQPLAAPASRFLAWLLDAVIQMGIIFSVSMAASSLGVLAADLFTALGVILGFAVWLGYGMILEWAWRGRTVGKRALGLRVVDAEGFQLEPKQIVIRNLLRLVDSLPLFYLVGGVACVLSRKCQRLGDLVAGTVVLRATRPVEADLERILGGKYNSLRAHPHLEARLRQRVTPVEARVALLALVRRSRLDPDKRIDVFEQLADHFKQLMPFPEDATQGITAEQYVRNVVDVVFNTVRARKTAK